MQLFEESQAEVRGSLQQIIFRNEDNGYTIARFKCREEGLITVRGILGGLQPGEAMRCQGEWQEDKRYGKQFVIRNFELELPTTPEAMADYLGSGVLPGIGPAMAKRIVAKFKDKSLIILDKEPEKLLEIPGIGAKGLARIRKAWGEQQQMRGLVIFLQQYQISQTFARRIYQFYGEAAIGQIKSNPYRLASDIEGIGFQKADALAQQLNIGSDSPQRLEASLMFKLEEQARAEGHTALPETELIFQTERLVAQPREALELALEQLVRRRKLVRWVEAETGQVFIQQRGYYDWEEVLALRIRIFAESQPPPKLQNLGLAEVEKAADSLNIELAEAQTQALLNCLSKPLHLITGGPGTGKSTLTKVLCKVLDEAKVVLRLAAPTGRAAKRLSEITGREAQTVHSMLEYDFARQSFKRNRQNPLETQFLLVDEAGMLDTYLLFSLWEALPPDACCVLVGDIDQLPSVGPGHVLRDLLAAEEVPVTRLTEVFRQAQGSDIIRYAHDFRQGQLPQFNNHKQSDCFFLEKHSGEDITVLLSELLCDRLPKAYGFDAHTDIQVLSPMNKGDLGTQQLNKVFQQRLRRPEELQSGYLRGEVLFCRGDKVIQMRNNYDKDVFNGDIGRIENLYLDERYAQIRFDDKLLDYTFADFMDLEPAYCVSVHKYQGSESPCILMPVHESHHMMLYRNLYYTGLTRGKRLVIMVGSKQALAKALFNERNMQRYTGLPMQLYRQSEQGESLFTPTVLLPELGAADYETALRDLYQSLGLNNNG